MSSEGRPFHDERLQRMRERLEETRRAMQRMHESARQALDDAQRSRADVTAGAMGELRRHLADVDRARTVAEELVAAKDRYIATFAHEVRQAVHGALTAVSLIRLRQEATTTLRACEILDRQLRRIARLVDDVVSMARAQTDEVRIERTSVSLRDILDSAVATAQPRLDERRHHLSVDVSACSLWVIGDASRLEQVFANLLVNAAHYTPHGGHINVECTAEGNEVVTRVSDDGCGLTPDECARIFQPFTKSADSQGLGVGLPLAAAIVARHGGTIAVASNGRGRGSTFTVRLPAAPADAGATFGE